jgi:hypothetical protein
VCRTLSGEFPRVPGLVRFAGWGHPTEMARAWTTSMLICGAPVHATQSDLRCESGLYVVTLTTLSHFAGASGSRFVTNSISGKEGMGDTTA